MRMQANTWSICNTTTKDNHIRSSGKPTTTEVDSSRSSEDFVNRKTGKHLSAVPQEAAKEIPTLAQGWGAGAKKCNSSKINEHGVQSCAVDISSEDNRPPNP